MKFILALLLITLTGCVGVPEGIEPVNNFDVNRYLGKWYEIARLDHSFERGLQQVSAEYSLRPDGGIEVINRGRNISSGNWKEAEGKAYFVGNTETAHLKVSFFGPFYGSYIVFALGPDYEYSLITSSNRSYLWLLSRSPDLAEDVQNALLEKMTAAGFDTEKLIYIEHSTEADGHNASENQTKSNSPQTSTLQRLH